MPSDKSPPPPSSALGTALVHTLAERGLIGRPLFIWLGPKTPLGCLSPYADDLADLIAAWAQGPGHSAVADVLEQRSATRTDGPLPRALRWALALRFCEQSSALAEERQQMEAQLGITSVAPQPAGPTADLCDLFRLGPAILAQLGVPYGPQPLGVVIRLPWQKCPVTLAETDADAILACADMLARHPALSIQHLAIVSAATDDPGAAERCDRLKKVWVGARLPPDQPRWLVPDGDEPSLMWLYQEARRFVWDAVKASTPRP